MTIRGLSFERRSNFCWHLPGYFVPEAITTETPIATLSPARELAHRRVHLGMNLRPLLRRHPLQQRTKRLCGMSFKYWLLF
jgi:hypothetical protein